MKGIDLLHVQLRGSCDQVVAHARDAEPFWSQRAFPGSSLPGFVAWHCARIVDWGLSTVVREVAEVAAAPPWRDRVRYDLGHGAGIDDAEADELTATVRPADVVAYAQVLRDSIDVWASTVADGDLDRVPSLRLVNQVHPRYASDAAWAEIEALEGLPAWQFLARPCVGHIRVHIGELATLCQIMQAG
ncbi:MAG TPA: hypothetical protein VIG86_13130 [Candidatus Dormibacteraeota bacterium]|jgi:hypothetical protein